MNQIKVLVVDDSLLFRNLLVQSLNADPFVRVVAQAGDAYEARDAIIEHRPDVMTLDVELPRMNGIEFLKRLMPQCPLPVVMVSALSDKVFDALNAGAVDFIHKPAGADRRGLGEFFRQELATKIKIASTAKVGKLKQASGYPGKHPSFAGGLIPGNDRVLAIGASTGGTEAIYEVVRQFDRDIPGTVVVQHMPPGFTKMYADRLNNQCRVAVKEAKTGDMVFPGQILLAPGDRQMKLVKNGNCYQVECRGEEKVSGHCPSVDVLFASVARAAGAKAVGVLLTGMGRDGAEGLLEMRKRGAATIGQDEASCVVYGMPKAAYDIGAVQYQAKLSDIPGKIYQLFKQGGEIG